MIYVYTGTSSNYLTVTAALRASDKKFCLCLANQVIDTNAQAVWSENEEILAAWAASGVKPYKLPKKWEKFIDHGVSAPEKSVDDHSGDVEITGNGPEQGLQSDA